MDIATFRLSAEQFDGIASGYGDASALATLRAGQVSRRRLLLRAVSEAAPASAPALDLLAEAERYAPAVFSDALVHPLLTAWATTLLRRRRAGAPADLGYLSAFAAAVAARAGVEFEIRAPVRKGAVALPTLGTAVGVKDDDRTGETIVHGDGAVLTVGHVRVQAPFTARCPGWRPRLVAGPGAPAIEDADPYRDCFHYPPTAPLDSAQLASFAHLLRDAWDHIEADYPSHAMAMRGTLTAVVPVIPPNPDRAVSAATPNAFGAVAMSVPSDAATTAELLIHEFQHMKLSGLSDIVQLTTTPSRTLYHAPWRADPRPIGALLQGAYAHTGVTDFWRIHRRRGTGSRARRAHLEFAYWLTQTREAVATLAASTELTAVGKRFATRLGATLDGWRSEPVPTDVSVAADRLATAAAVGWRLRNYAAAPSFLAALTRQWLAGSACPSVPMPVLAKHPPGPAQPCALATAIRLSVLDPGHRPEPDTGEAALLSDLPTARKRYAAQLRQQHDDDSWIGLTLALLDEVPAPAAQALLARPDLVRTVCQRGDADPARVAGWLAPGLGPMAVTATVGRCRS